MFKMHPSFYVIFGILIVSNYGQCWNQSPLTIADPKKLVVQTFSKLNQPIFPPGFLKAAENLPTMMFDNKYLSSIKDINCTNAIKQLTKDFSNNKPYALKVLDSWSRPESGMINGNLIWEGRYYECIQSSDGTNITGKYCSASIALSTKLIPRGYIDIFDVPITQLGVCFPDICSSSDVSALFSSYLPVGKVRNVNCPTKFTKWEAKDISAMFIVSLLLLLAVLSTSYDYITQQQNAASTNEDLSNLVGGDLDLSRLQQRNTSTGTVHKLLVSFSVIQNTRRLLDTKQRASDINCLHGIRFLSMSWIILGHSFAYLIGGYTDNLKSAAKYLLEHYDFQLISNGSFAVDTFFYLSGLLVTYIGIVQIKRRNGRLNILKMYLHRYIRLTPPYAFLLLISISLYPMIGDGPWWASSVQPLIDSCEKYWYSNLLYFNNLYPAWLGAECYSWGWYLANDMQFYIISPIFIWTLYKSPKIGLTLLALVTIAGMAITGKFASVSQVVPSAMYYSAMAEWAILPPFELLDSNVQASGLGDSSLYYITDLYTKPWCRIGAYLVGMITGYILHANNNNVKMNKVIVAVGWGISSVVCFLIVFCLYPYYDTGLSNKLSAFYLAVARPVWSVCLGWVTIACVSGYGGPANTLLSWKAFIPLSRLTYCAYLIHPLCIWWFVATSETQYHFTIHSTFLLFFTLLFTSYLLAYLVVIFVEFPFVQLLKCFENRDGNTAVAVVHQTPVNQ